MKIAVVGAGSWGTTLADLLARGGNQVRIWAREQEVVESINNERVNSLFLAGCRLHEGLRACEEIDETVAEVELVVSATPSHAVREISQRVFTALNGAEPVVVSISKGLEADTLKVMTEVMGETMPGCKTVALSGPSFADEVYERHPTAVVAAGEDVAAAELTQKVFANSYFRVYSSRDPLGVQLGGALKNVIAIASGAIEGMGMGHNPSAALITRGLAEMTRLGQALGCNPMTFGGLAGMGDLILTASGPQSRNRSLGEELGKGRKLQEILAERRTVAEGVRTTEAAVSLSEQTGVELPIAQEVGNVLFRGKELRQAISDLMERELKPEHWE
ncbi:MAG: NAD(P)-dependent glycerol-3-phosphate dehydrogenase [Gemmatimonadota bacterium]|nr:MAG: NAD(P)-dependent glycerol-3-phosphate dehydrogenase [Gemmatimonadota bacterium]